MRHKAGSIRLLLAVALLLPAEAGLAREPAVQDPAKRSVSAEKVVDDAADRRRLLTLDDGRVLRARSRKLDGRWQTRIGRDWVDFDGEVVATRLEKEAVAEGRRRAAGLKRTDREGRVKLAEWMAHEGLGAEAIRELDRVLAEEPEHRGALALIERAYLPLELPTDPRGDKAAEIRAILVAGAQGSPATREVAARRLADQAPFVDLRKVVQAELQVPQNRRREFAAQATRRLFPGELVRPLTDRAILDTNGYVRAEASRGLRDAADVAVLAPAINALGSKYASVRGNAAEAMGNMGYAAAVEPLIHHLGAAAQSLGGTSGGARANIFLGFNTAYVQDYDVEIAQAASIADPIIAVQESGVAFDVRTAIQMTKVIEMRKTVRALQQLTRAEVGDSPEAWADWWERNRAEWRSLDHAKRTTRAR